MALSQSMMLDLGTDVVIRRRLFDEASFAHPAKLHLGLLQWILDRYTRPGQTIGDPMAGIGGLLLASYQGRNVVLREIEPRWLELAHRNVAQVYQAAGWFTDTLGAINIAQADARQPWDWHADHIVFSPPYGCSAGVSPSSHAWFSPTRYALHKNMALAARWRAALENPTAGTQGAMIFHYGQHPQQIGHWRGARYWEAMTDIYRNAYAALRDGVMVVIIKDHIRKHQHVHVADDTVRLCERLGFDLVERHARRVWPLSLWQRRRKEKGQPIIEHEDVLVFTKGLA